MPSYYHILVVHPGMNLEHQQMPIKECEELKLQGLIEATTSAWACHAFYVNKRFEQVRGKQCWNVISCYHITQWNSILKFYNILQESSNTY